MNKDKKTRGAVSKVGLRFSFPLSFDSWGHEAASVTSFRIARITELEILYLQSKIQEPILLSY